MSNCKAFMYLDIFFRQIAAAIPTAGDQNVSLLKPSCLAFDLLLGFTEVPSVPCSNFPSKILTCVPYLRLSGNWGFSPSRDRNIIDLFALPLAAAVVSLLLYSSMRHQLPAYTFLEAASSLSPRDLRVAFFQVFCSANQF